MIDSHCHFDFAPFSEDPAHYLALARQAGVNKLVIPAVGVRNWKAVRQLATEQDGVYFALGLHPFFSADHTVAAEQQLAAELEAESLLRAKNRSHCVAVGECGLDFAIAEVDRDQQLTLLSSQLRLANHYGLPVILHCRKAYPELLRLLKQIPPVAGGVYHAFSGSLEQARQMIDLGLKIGVGGTITYERAKKTRAAIAQLPLSALLLETDAPDMPVAGFQGQPNRPDRLVAVMDALVTLRSEPREEIEKVITLTTAELFHIPH